MPVGAPADAGAPTVLGGCVDSEVHATHVAAACRSGRSLLRLVSNDRLGREEQRRDAHERAEHERRAGRDLARGDGAVGGGGAVTLAA